MINNKNFLIGIGLGLLILITWFMYQQKKTSFIPSLTPTIIPTPATFCQESLPADLCDHVGGDYHCLNGPCICVCP